MQPTNLNLKAIARDATLRGDTKTLFHALDLLERVVPAALIRFRAGQGLYSRRYAYRSDFIGTNWIHEIKHDGYRLMARRDSVGIRLITRRGNDWSHRFPFVVEAVNHLKGGPA